MTDRVCSGRLTALVSVNSVSLEDTRENDEGDHDFPPSGRKPTVNENNKWPGDLIMKTDLDTNNKANDHWEILVPLIGLRGLQHVLYKPLVCSILEVNRDMVITHAGMQTPMDAMVHNIYHFGYIYIKERRRASRYLPATLGLS